MTSADSGARPHSPPPDVSDPAEFAAALSALRARAGLSIRQVSRLTEVPSATLGGYFSGRHLPTVSQGPAFAEVLTALGVSEAESAEWLIALERVRRAARQPRGRVSSPYRGLASYGADDAEWYLGRESLVEELVRRVTSLRAVSDRPRVLTVIGASGSGKSSLLNAGLLAGLRRRGTPAAAIAPGGAPLAALDGTGGVSVLVVDQFEEIFTEGASPTTRERFVEALLERASAPGDLVVVLALRADFFGSALEEPALFPVVSTGQFIVGPMDLQALRTVIVEPSERAGRPVDDDLVDVMLRDVSGRGVPDASALPLLSHALLSTWNHTGQGRLTIGDYVATGGVAGAVQRTAEGVFRDLDDAERITARRLFWQLVSVDDEGFATRRRVFHADLVETEALAAVIEAFVSQRILTATETTLEIGHEVLLEAWPRLKEWVTEDRDDLAMRRRIAHGSADWEASERDPAALMRDPLLTVAARLVERKPEALTVPERDFLDASLAKQEDDLRADRRRQRRLGSLLATVAVLALVTTGLSVILVRALDETGQQRADADIARDEALSRGVALQAAQLRASDPSLAGQVSLAAYDLAPTVEAGSALLDTPADGLATRLVGVEGTTRAVVNPAGTLAAVASADGRLRLWERPDHELPTLVGTVDTLGSGALFAAEFSPDGSLVAVGDDGGRVSIVDVSNPRQPQVWPDILRGPAAAVQGVAFSPDGDTLWAATSDPGVFGWRLGDRSSVALPRVTAPVDGQADASVQTVAVSEDGRVATGGSDGLVRIWRRDGDRLIPESVLSATDIDPQNWVNSVAFSPDGRLVVAASRDRRVRVWTVDGASRAGPLRAHAFASYVNGVSFDTDGSRLAIVGSTGVAEVWDTTTWTRQDAFSGDTNFTSAAFVPGTDHLLTASLDGVTRVWRTDGPRISDFASSIWSLSYSQSGRRFYAGVGGSAPEIVEFDTSVPDSPRRTGRVFRGPARAGALVGTMAVAPDGRLLVGGTDTGNLVVWRIDGAGPPERPGVVRASAGIIQNVQFSPDGRYFASAGDDGRVQVFEGDADELTDGRPERAYALTTSVFTIGLGFSADNDVLAVGTAAADVRLWRLGDGEAQALPTLSGLGNDVYSVAFSPDGHTLFTGGADESVRIWDVSDPTDVTAIGRPLRGPTGVVWGIAVSPEGDQFGAASSDGHLWVWDYTDGRATLSARLSGTGEQMTQLARDPAAAGYAGAGPAGISTYWGMDLSEAREQICATAGTPITRREWEQFVPGAPYDPPCPGPAPPDA